MADRAISQLNPASSVTPQDLFLLEQNGEAKNLTGQYFITWLTGYADGHGGIQTMAKTSSTGENPVVDVYTITYADETTSVFTVTNGVKGDTGDQTYVWIKYAGNDSPTTEQMSDSPNRYIGIYTGTESTAPTAPGSYNWYQWKGDTGDPATLNDVTPFVVGYQESPSGTAPPTGGVWAAEAPASPTSGWFTWSRTQLNFVDEDPVYVYSVSRNARDGTGVGTVISVNGVNPDANGNVLLSTYVSIASISAFPVTVNDANITADMRVIECKWGNPTAVTSDVSWITADGSITLSGSIGTGLTTSAEITLMISTTTA